MNYYFLFFCPFVLARPLIALLHFIFIVNCVEFLYYTHAKLIKAQHKSFPMYIYLYVKKKYGRNKNKIFLYFLFFILASLTSLMTLVLLFNSDIVY